MSRPLRFRIAALNIVTHPHSAKIYADLFWTAFKLGRLIKIAGDLHGKMVTCFRLDLKDPTAGFTGEIFRFLNLDPTADWFNLSAGEPATEEELEELKIPDNLKPHLQRIRYVFFPETHRFVFVQHSHAGAMAPERVRQFVYNVLNDPALAQRFPHAEATVMQDPAALEAIFELPMLRTLEIKVARPNADADDDEEDIMKELEREKLSRKTLILEGEGGESITPDAHTRKLARVAVSNGYVEAKGRDAEGHRVIKNTASAPLMNVFDVRENEPFLERFVEKARELVNTSTRE